MADAGKTDFFISYRSSDESWATWLAWQLEDMGCTTFLQAWDFRPGGNFVAQMHKGTMECARTLAVLTPAYFESGFTKAEWCAAFANDPTGEQGLLLPVRVAECDVEGLLGQVIYVNLVGLDEREAQQRLIAGVNRSRAKPVVPPRFPGTTAGVSPKPGFPGTNPYRGLAAFREVDSPYFYGREADAEAVWRTVQDHPFVALVGASGSGKSSLLFAGVVPRLRGADSWQIASFRPKGDPFAEAASALAQLAYPDLDKLERREKRNQLARKLSEGDLSVADVMAVLAEERIGQRVLLAADQFEELYTQNLTEDRQRRFIDSLLTVVGQNGQSTLLISLRADFLGYTLDYAPLAEKIARYPRLIVPPIARDGLRAAIEGPAAQLGVRLEPGLADHILDDLGTEPGALPLLEFALTELWERQRNGTLTHADYEAIGGVSQALAHYADAVARRFTEREQDLHRVFVQLVRPGEGTEDSRQVATREQLGDTEWALVKQLADERLVVTGATEEQDGRPVETVEVVHEALIRHWRPLRQWVSEDRAFRVWQNRLRQALQDWRQGDRDDGALLRGARLVEAEERLANDHDRLSPAERDFIHESLALRNRETEARRRRRRLTVGSLAAGLAIALALMTAAGVSYWRAEAARSRYLMRLSEEALEEGLTLRAARFSLLAVPEGWRPDEPAVAVRARNVLRSVLSLARSYELGRHTGNVWAISSIFGGTHVVSGGDDGTLMLWNVSNPEQSEEIGHAGDKIYMLAVAPDQRHLATAGGDGRVLLWDALNTIPPRELSRHDSEVYAVAISPSGSMVISGGHDGKILSWDLNNGGEPTKLGQHEGDVWAINFAPDGRRVISAGGDGRVMLWDPDNGEASRELDHLPDQVTALAVCPDGAAIITGGGRGEIYSVPLEGHAARNYIGRHNGEVYSLYVPECSRVISAGEDGQVRLWNTSIAGSYRTLARTKNRFVAVKGMPTSTDVIAGTDNGRIILLDTKLADTSTVVANLIGRHRSYSPILKIHLETASFISADSDGDILTWKDFRSDDYNVLKSKSVKALTLGMTGDMSRCIVGDEKGDIFVYFKCESDKVQKIGHHDRVWLMEASDDADKILSVGFDGQLLLWEYDRPEHPRHLGFYDGKILTISVPLRDKAFLGDADGKVIRVDYGKSVKLSEIGTHDSRIIALAAEPHGSSVVAADSNGRIVRWAAEINGNKVEVGKQSGKITSLAFDPGGRYLASGDENGNILIYDADKQAIPLAVGQQNGPVRAVEVQRDANILLTGSSNGEIWLWYMTADVFTVARGESEFRRLSDNERKLAGMM